MTKGAAHSFDHLMVGCEERNLGRGSPPAKLGRPIVAAAYSRGPVLSHSLLKEGIAAYAAVVTLI